MFDAISTAWQRSPPGHAITQCAFIAGMREAAKIAEAERLTEALENDADEAYCRAITHVRIAIEAQADELEEA